MNKKKFFAALFFIVSFFTLIPVAMADETLVRDMQMNPKNYIYIGSTGSGLGKYISKSLIDVQQYNPPKYIIATKLITYSENRSNSSAEISNFSDKYFYDYNERKIYIEEKNGPNVQWQYLDTKSNNFSRRELQKIAIAEFLFYFTYNKSFFDKPVSAQLKKYIETGKGTFDNWWQR